MGKLVFFFYSLPNTSKLTASDLKMGISSISWHVQVLT